MKTKTFKVVMLPVHKATSLCTDRANGIWKGKLYDFDEEKLSAVYENQHLYITSDDKIKDGDFVYDSLRNYVHQQTTKMQCNGHIYNKVVASTDKSITPNSWIPKLYVSDYVKAYNMNLPFTEIQLEVADKEYGFMDFIVYSDELMRRKDGSVVLDYAHKKVYTKKEVVKLIQDTAIWFGVTHIPEDDGTVLDKINKYIEEKL